MRRTTNYHDDRAFVELLRRCRELRRDPTDAESLLWWLLRNRQLAGVKFRRQHPYGPYILDFYCPERQLAVEADGSQHLEHAEVERDAARTRYLEASSLRVLRFSNLEILGETDSVLQVIWRAVVGEA